MAVGTLLAEVAGTTIVRQKLTRGREPTALLLPLRVSALSLLCPCLTGSRSSPKRVYRKCNALFSPHIGAHTLSQPIITPGKLLKTSYGRDTLPPAVAGCALTVLALCQNATRRLCFSTLWAGCTRASTGQGRSGQLIPLLWVCQLDTFFVLEGLEL